jgi:hypothetical protein
MPVNKFGSSKNNKPATNIIHAGGVSLSYLDTNFLRKGDDERIGAQGGNIQGDINMFGRISMNGNRVRGLPNRVENDDEAVNKLYVDEKMSQLTELIKTYVCSRGVITVSAMETGSLQAGHYEWSFGDNVGRTTPRSGYCLPANGRIISMSLNSEITGSNAKVALVIDGNEQHDYFIMKHGNERAVYRTFDTPLDLAAGSVINFVTKTNTQRARYSVVALLIEIRM